MTSPWQNPVGTDGCEFVEYAAPDPAALGLLFERMGFHAVARHRHKNVLLYKQGDVNFIVNAEPRSFAQNFARRHGPSVCAIAFRVRDAASAYEKLLERGAWGVESRPGPGELSIRVGGRKRREARRTAQCLLRAPLRRVHHVGNFDLFPAAPLHLQDLEMNYATGRHMGEERHRYAYEVEEVVGMVRRVYQNRVRFHHGDGE